MNLGHEFFKQDLWALPSPKVSRLHGCHKGACYLEKRKDTGKTTVFPDPILGDQAAQQNYLFLANDCWMVV